MASQGWFRYKLNRLLTEDEVEAVRALAGPVYLDKPRIIVAHINCAWLTERWLRQQGIGYYIAARPKPEPEILSITVLPELREWVPAFLTHYQNDFIQKMAGKDGVLAVMPTGAGKTLAGIVYGLLRQGPIVFVTRAAARRTICGEIRKYTTCEPVLLEGKQSRIIPPDTRFTVVGWESLNSHYVSLLKLHPTTVIFDEIHVASNHKRREAIVVRDEEAMEAARVEGKVQIEYRRLSNRFAAAEDLSRKCDFRLGLTATPIRDRVRNLWGQLDLLNPRGWGTFYPWAFRYCNPAEAPIWMGDFTFKRIADVQVGDEVVGWAHKAPGPSRRGGSVRKMHKSHLTRATVTQVQCHVAPVVRVTFASGRVIRCTADHRWLSGRTGTNNPSAFVTPAVGRELAFVTDPTPAALSPEHQHLAGWLAGMYDGEGSNSFICQSSEHNPATWAKLDQALTALGISHTMLLDADRKSGCGGVLITGGREGLLRFHKLTRPVRFARSAEKTILTGKFRTPDEIVRIDADGEEPVYALTTTTGNYVAWGYASKNCGAHESPWGGINTDGRGTDSDMQELVGRLSFSTYYIPQSVTHRDLPPMRRQVTYIPPEELSTGRDVLKELKEHGYQSATGEVWAKLAHAAAMKRDRVVEEAVAGAYRAPDGRGGGKVVVFTGLRADAEKIAQKIEAAAAKGLAKGAPKLTVFMGHGGTPNRDAIREAYMAHPGPCVLVGTGDSWGECVRPDTFILGEQKAIADYQRGDRLVGASGLVGCRGVKTKHFDGEMVEVRAQGMLPFAATPHHPVFVVAGSITPGRGRHFTFDGKAIWKNIEAVKPWDPSPRSPKNAAGDFVLLPRLAGHLTNVTLDLDKYVARPSDVMARRARGAPGSITLDADMAWLMGLYAAEGSASARGANGQGIRAFFSLGSHEGTVASRAMRIMASRGIRSTVNPLPKTNGMNVTVRSGPFARLLRDLMGDGAHQKRIPDEVLFNTDLAIVLAFIQGYAMGDGHTDGNKVQTASVSLALTLQMQLAVARLGRFAGITPWKTKGGSIRGRPVKASSYYILTWRWQNMRHERFKVLERAIAVPVKAVRHVPYVGPVMDVGSTDQTFLASNAVVHNSLNLQDTDLAIIAMLPWTPGQIRQWEGRFKRQGMTRPVLLMYLVAEGTADEHVAHALLNKLPAVEMVAKDEVLTEFAVDLRGDEDAVAAGFLAKLTAGEDDDDEDDEDDEDPDGGEEDPNRLAKD